jgi:putative transposase
MARRPRIELINQPHHLTARGNNRQAIFIAEDDYAYYLELLLNACEKHNCLIHAYVLMTNHVHILLTPNEPGAISKVMQSLGRRYVQYFNYSYQRTGTLMEGRYKSSLIDSEHYALTCYRYIELNPVRAGMVNHPRDYPWSSYHANAAGKKDDLITPHPLYLGLAIEPGLRQKRYQALFKQALTDQQLSDIRGSTSKNGVIGSDLFKEEVEAMLNIRVRPKPRGGDRRSKQYQQKSVDEKLCFN